MAIPKIATQGTETLQHRLRVAESLNNIADFSYDDSRTRTPAEALAGVTPVNPAYPPGDIRRYGATTGSTDNTLAFSAAISTGHAVYVPEGVWFGKMALIEGTCVYGAHRDSATVQIPAGSADVVFTATSKNSISVFDLTISGDGGATGGGVLYFNDCDNVRIGGVRSQSSPGPGLRMNACDYMNMQDVHVDDSGAVDSSEWGMQVDNCDYSYCANLLGTNCSNRFVMVRDSEYSAYHGVTGNSNGGTAFWFHDCNYCHAVGVTDRGDTLGDSAVISGASVGCTIRDLVAINSGGHGASIASDDSGAPISCHFDGVYSSGQGECMAAISDQGTGSKPTHCTILNVKGRNCGLVTASEGFALVNTVNCVISGSISDNDTNDMTYAVSETGSAPTGNRFEIISWVSGSSGYFSMSASNSSIDFPRLANGGMHVGDAALSWDPAVDSRLIIYDIAALTANRNITLASSWPGDKVRVVRAAAATGAFNLTVNTTLKTLATASLFADFYYDGANWNLTASGAV